MEQKTERFYLSAPLENKILEIEQRLEKKYNNVNSFLNSIFIFKEMISSLKDYTINQKRNTKKMKL